MIKFISLILCGLIATGLYAQEEAAASSQPTIQPTIMAIPFARNEFSTLRAYDASSDIRIALTKVKEAFDQRGVNTIDLRAKMKQVTNSETLTEEQERTFKDDLIKISGADIYVEVEVKKERSSAGNSATVIMTAYDAFSGESLANKVGNSPKFRTEDYSKLIEKAVESEIDNLLAIIQQKFDLIIENGRTVTLEVGIGVGEDFDLDSEVDDSGYFLSELIENWVEENAYKNYYHMQGTSDTRIFFDIVKVPVKDNRGKNFRLSKFVVPMRNYLKTLGLKADRTIVGSTITITLTELEQ